MKCCRRWRKPWAFRAAPSAGRPIEASVEQFKQLQERRWDQVEILVIYIDGQRYHILRAVDVDLEGHTDPASRHAAIARGLSGRLLAWRRSLP